MYQILKKISRTLFSQNFLFENEENFRAFLYPIYAGKNHQCNICEKKIKNFITTETQKNICPMCGSLPRTRLLWKLLKEEFLKPNLHILDFSPSRALYRKLKNIKNIQYSSSDFENEFLADFKYDITNINKENENFNLIICYHILEHIENDEKAISELFRVLKKNGVCLIQTPFKEGEIYEDFSIKSREERLIHFGQEDHVRIYSINSLENRLQKAGFKTETRTFRGDNFQGFSDKEIVIICRKQ